MTKAMDEIDLRVKKVFYFCMSDAVFGLNTLYSPESRRPCTSSVPSFVLAGRLVSKATQSGPLSISSAEAHRASERVPHFIRE